MGHHTKTLHRVDQNYVEGNVCTCLRRCGATYQRRRIDSPCPAGALLERIRRTAGGAETAVEILHGGTGTAGLIDDGLGALGPVGEIVGHRTRSRNMLT